MRKVLVTGISGFLASHAVKLCVDQGYAVRGTIYNQTEYEKLDYLKKLKDKGANVEVNEARLEDFHVWDEMIKGCDHVLHIAAPWETAGVNLKKMNEIMMNGITAILENSYKHKVKSVVTTGTALNMGIYSGMYKSVYTEDDWIEEENKKGFLSGKVEMEKFAWEYHRKMNIKERFRLTFIHPGIIYGPALTKLAPVSLQQIINMMTRRVILYNICLPISDVRDVALAHVKAMENPVADGKRYLCSGGSLWFDEIPQVIEKEFGFKCKKMPKGNFLMKIIGMFSNEADSMNDRTGVKFELSNKLIQKDLRLKFHSQKQTIIDTVRSLMENGIIPKLQIPNKINNKK